MPKNQPGESWRILAHEVLPGYRYGSRELDIRSKAYPVSPSAREDNAQRLDHRTVLDEVVIGDWLHMEQMGDRGWWLQIGDAYVYVHLPARGLPEVTIRRGEYGPVCGETDPDPAPHPLNAPETQPVYESGYRKRRTLPPEEDA